MDFLSASRLALVVVAVHLAGCQATTFDVASAEIEPPAKASVAALTTGAELVWSAVPEATQYRVFLGNGPEELEAVDPPVAETRYAWNDLVAGQRYYAAVQSIGADADELSETSATLAVEPLRSLPGIPPRGMQVDAGLVRTVVLGDFEGLKLASWSDLGGGLPEDQVCVIVWNNEADADVTFDPCNPELPDDAEWTEPGRFQPVLYVEDGSGRIGEAYTTVYVR